ncbi:MAG TPA: M48 family metalloprotease [Gaiellaceae bacterium]|nr:M48 family metalloprotease [Gaiellaceae bacterium]
MTLQQQIRANRLKSGIVVFGFLILLLIVAGLIGAIFDLSLGIVALAGAAIYALFALLQNRRMIARMTGAQEVDEDQIRPLHRLVENVSIAAGLPVTPQVRIVDDPAPNAFAAGLRPQTSYLGVTTGLLRTMPKRELEAVLGHEISHVRHRDTYLMTMATIFAGVIALIADIGFRMLIFGGGRSRKGGGALIAVVAIVGLLLAPYAALLLRLSLSRRREFLADAGSAEILNDPEAMALALRRLQLDTTTIKYADASVAHLWVESPTSRVETERTGVSALSSLFDTHPPLERRIAALEEAGGFTLPDALAADTPFGVELGIA